MIIITMDGNKAVLAGGAELEDRELFYALAAAKHLIMDEMQEIKSP